MATESALAMVMAEMRQVATEANTDPLVRREAINAQIAALVAQRDALDQGVLPEVNHRDLVDRVVALSHLVERIPADVGHYGEHRALTSGRSTRNRGSGVTGFVWQNLHACRLVH